MKKYEALKYSHRSVVTFMTYREMIYQLTQSRGNGSTVKQLKSVFMPVADVTCIPTLNVFMRKMVS